MHEVVLHMQSRKARADVQKKPPVTIRYIISGCCALDSALTVLVWTLHARGEGRNEELAII